MKKKKWIVMILVVAMVLTSFAGCGKKKEEKEQGTTNTEAPNSTESTDAPDDSAEKKENQTDSNKTDSKNAEKTTLVYGSGDYTSINPAIYEHGEINSLLFLGLTAHNSKNEVIPGLADHWEWDEENLTYTFYLKENLTFHDGTPLTTEDVKFTLDTIMNPENGSEIASNYEDITNINVIDEKTIAITLSAPNVAMLDYLVIGILPKHLLEGKDIITDEFNTNPIGSGPYKLVSWDMGQSIVLEKFDEFCFGTPKMDEIIFKIVPDSDARALQLKSGELDLAQITPKSAKEFEGQDEFVVNSMKTADYRGIMYNFNSDFFGKHKELPNILSYAIDRQAIVDSVLLGHGEVAYSPLQMGPYNNPDIEKFEYNPEKAKQLLEEAGWVMGANGYYEKDGEELGFEINNGQSDQVRIDMSNICAQNLQEIGCNAVVKVVSETDWAKQDSYLIGWGSPFDPDDHTYKVFGTDKGANYNGYSNESIDKLLQQARELETYEERLPIYQEFQKEMTTDMPYTFIAYIDAMYVAKKGLTGITTDTVLGHHGVGIFWNVYEWELQ